MAERRTQPARGMRDFLPEEVRRRQYVIDVVRGVYERYWFDPLETPALENIETLTGKYGDEGNKLIFKVLRRGEHETSGETDLALRYDLTVPLARVVAEHRRSLPRFFKRYQIQPVWRADRPARGRFREFYQCDVDAIGSTSPVVEAEMLAAVSDVLHELGFEDFTIRLGHREVLRSALEELGVPAALRESALVAIDKLDKIGPEGVENELTARGVPAASAARWRERAERQPVGPLDRSSVNSYILSASAERLAAFPAALAGLENLSQIVRLCEATSAGRHVVVDASLARGLSYYTGAIMEIAVEAIGSLGGGGRYDGLIGMFSGEQIPACGFSLGLERVLVVMAERGMFPAQIDAAGVDVLVTIFDADLAAESLRLAGELRQSQVRVEVYPEPLRRGKDLDKAFKYAGARRAAFVAVLGPDEIATREVTLRNMNTRQKDNVARASAGAIVKSLIASGGAERP
ncbi:MAG: histidine--tRNA ligase [Vicinamibacterales bacterium]